MPYCSPASRSSSGDCCGWRAINFHQGGAIDLWTSPDTVEEAHVWVYPRAVAQSAVGPTDILYADMPTLEFRIRATLVAGSPPSSGGLDVWRDLTTEQPTWWVNSGGSPGEIGTSTVLLEIAQYLPSEEAVGPVLADGQYTIRV